MIKVKTTVTTYKSVVLRRAILICWVLLFVCFVVKIFGGNYFAIIVNSPKFVAFCKYLDSNIFLYGLIGLISSLISYFFYYLAILKKLMFSKREFIIYITSVIVFCVLRVSLIHSPLRNAFSYAINFIQYFVVPFLFEFHISKRNIVRTTIAFVLNLIFQIVSIITKNIGIRYITDSSLEMIIFTIDVYIMLVLYYLYSNIINNKEV